MIDSFEGTGCEFVIINAAGCGHTLKEYGHILQDDPEYREKAKEFGANVKDVQEFLAKVNSKTTFADKPPLVYQTVTITWAKLGANASVVAHSE